MAARRQGGLLSYFTVAKVCRDSEVVVNRDEINESVNSDHEDNNIGLIIFYLLLDVVNLFFVHRIYERKTEKACRKS